MTSPQPGRLRARLSALPGLIENAPARVVGLVGAGLVVLGLLVIVRPLASLMVLGIYVGISAIASGVLEFARHRGRAWWTRTLSVAWIVGGLAILVWLGRSIEFLPIVLAVLLIVSGLATLGDALAARRVSVKVLAATWGAAQVLFGVVSLSWPDVTLLAVAVYFGLRTIVFGGELLAHAVRNARRGRDELGDSRNAREKGEGAPSGKRSRRWVAGGRYALSVLLVGLMVGGWQVHDWLSAGAPVVDAFYDAPADVPSGHGRLLRTGDYAGRAPQGGDVQRILYTTQDARGQDAVASAMVIVPTRAADGPRPVVIWNHGTTGIAQGCAPSLADGTATKWAIPAVEDMLERGWVVVAPDYVGQGTQGTFPYLIGLGEAHSALDAVLAAGEVDDLTLSPRTIVAGHSQGGHAALWTSQVAGDYTPGVTVMGTAGFAAAADPLDLANRMSVGGAGRLLPLMMSWVLIPYSETYPDIELSNYVATGAGSLIREISQRCLSEPGLMVSALTALGISEDDAVRTGDLTEGALAVRLGENTPMGPWSAPIFLTWSARDEVIPPVAQHIYVNALCAQGDAVRVYETVERGHQGILQPGAPVLPVFMRWADAAMSAEVPGGAPDAGAALPYPFNGCTS